MKEIVWGDGSSPVRTALPTFRGFVMFRIRRGAPERPLSDVRVTRRAIPPLRKCPGDV